MTVIEVAESLTIDPGPFSPKFTDVALSRLVPEMTSCGCSPVAGPVFGLIASTIGRLESYTHMSDFGTCAVDWPLMDAWEEELARGELPS